MPTRPHGRSRRDGSRRAHGRPSGSVSRRLFPRAMLLGGLVGVMSLIAASLLVREWSPIGSKEQGKATLQALIIKWNGPLTEAAAGVVLGVNDGVFQKAGLSSRLEVGVDDDDVVKAVAASDRIIGHVSAMAFLRARAAGMPVVAIAGSYVASSIRLFALDTTALQTPSDLVGKTLAYRASSEVGFVVEALISRNAVQRSLVRATEATGTVEQLMAGAIDVLAGYLEVEGAELRRLKVPYRVLDPGAFKIHIPGTVYIASTQMLATSSSSAETFVSALLASWARADLDPRRTAALVAAAIGRAATPERSMTMLEQQRDLIRPFGARMAELDLARWQEFQRLLLQQRVISDPVDLRAAIDFSLVPDVYRRQSRSVQAD
ncbi:hypothetical protein WN72_11855 [Bradyrhizobium arachidis]|uniref:SsuA/THI5-like domain-containing protein n=2 Tax=Bradyrhizobium arachidis TaxID=858423 RepID=A0AAE7NJ09_9BRAD|nr:hypothetical protein WN72_11855 [Bradyrhizobium arachidis]